MGEAGPLEDGVEDAIGAEDGLPGEGADEVGAPEREDDEDEDDDEDTDDDSEEEEHCMYFK